MDYGKLSKPTLIEMCEAKKIPYSSSFSKDKLIDLLIEADLAAKKSTPAARPAASSNNYDDSMYETGPETLGKVGAILSLIYYGFWVFASILAVLACFPLAFLMLMAFVAMDIVAMIITTIMIIGLLLFVVLDILGLVFSIKYLNGKAKSKVAAGIFGIFAGILPGVFIFIAGYKSVNEIEEK